MVTKMVVGTVTWKEAEWVACMVAKKAAKRVAS